jgi:hypothetical protein
LSGFVSFVSLPCTTSMRVSNDARRISKQKLPLSSLRRIWKQFREQRYYPYLSSPLCTTTSRPLAHTRTANSSEVSSKETLTPVAKERGSLTMTDTHSENSGRNSSYSPCPYRTRYTFPQSCSSQMSEQEKELSHWRKTGSYHTFHELTGQQAPGS